MKHVVGTAMRRYSQFILPRFSRKWNLLQIVERTFAWLEHCRRLSQDFEVTVRHSENRVRIAMLKLTLNQLFENP